MNSQPLDHLDALAALTALDLPRSRAPELAQALLALVVPPSGPSWPPRVRGGEDESQPPAPTVIAQVPATGAAPLVLAVPGGESAELLADIADDLYSEEGGVAEHHYTRARWLLESSLNRAREPFERVIDTRDRDDPNRELHHEELIPHEVVVAQVWEDAHPPRVSDEPPEGRLFAFPPATDAGGQAEDPEP